MKLYFSLVFIENVLENTDWKGRSDNIMAKD